MVSNGLEPSKRLFICASLSQHTKREPREWLSSQQKCLCGFLRISSSFNCWSHWLALLDTDVLTVVTVCRGRSFHQYRLTKTRKKNKNKNLEAPGNGLWKQLIILRGILVSLPCQVENKQMWKSSRKGKGGGASFQRWERGMHSTPQSSALGTTRDI